MRKKQVLLLCAVCPLVAILVLLAHKPAPSEPSYDGHPLSYWVEMLGEPFRSAGPDPPPQYQEATKAIDHIGVSALPFLMKWIQYEPPRWRRTLANSLNGNRFPPVRQLSGLFFDPRARQLSVGAYKAFDALRTRAMPAFDDLCRFTNDTNRPSVAFKAAIALGYLGTNALSPLLALVANGNHPARVGALAAIHEIGASDNAAQILVIPAITNCITDTNRQVRRMAVTFLGDLTAAPQISVPALISALKSTDYYVRRASATSLAQFGPQAASAIPALTNALVDPDSEVRYSATGALHQIDPVTFTNAPSQ
jgi:hypothetical protein